MTESEARTAFLFISPNDHMYDFLLVVCGKHMHIFTGICIQHIRGSTMMRYINSHYITLSYLRLARYFLKLQIFNITHMDRDRYEEYYK